ncbi:hypothetical protein [Mycobacterium sp. 23]|uniref:hypothetical protein n=1 Tax=Mycobacterium sp. 23 TaxID=3400424 RepID=UPI003AAF7F67
MTDITELHRALVARILGGAAQTPIELRRAAFENAATSDPLRTLIDKVAHHSHQVTDDDVAAARDAGFSEDEIFEIAVCAAVGQAGRDYDSALATLAEATGR